MIQSFKSKDTEALFRGMVVPRFQNIKAVALRELDMLEATEKPLDLRAPPANRPEALAGDRKGQHSIRINDQYRLCFVWTDAGPAGLEIVDYHR